MNENLKKITSSVKKGLDAYFKPDSPVGKAFSATIADALLERDRLSDWLGYGEFDSKRNLVFLDDGEPAIGFMLCYSPHLLAGIDSAKSLEEVLKMLPDNSIAQFGVLSSDQIGYIIDAWARSRLINCQNDPLLKIITQRRREFMLKTSHGPSMLPTEELHPRTLLYYLSIRVPFTGLKSSKEDILNFVEFTAKLRDKVKAHMDANSLSSDIVTEDRLLTLLREMMNPHLSPSKRSEGLRDDISFNKQIIQRNTRITVLEDAKIGFSDGSEAPKKVVVPLTVDKYPNQLYIPSMSGLLGAPTESDSRISYPFWAYTTIEVLNRRSGLDYLKTNQGILAKQTMSESDWYKSVMGHLFVRKDEADIAVKQIEVNNHRPMRMYSGINVYCNIDEAEQAVSLVKALWGGKSFDVLEEKNITLPAFISSLPLQHSPKMDRPNKGLQRMSRGHTLNAANAAFIQGDWKGSDPRFNYNINPKQWGGGPLLVSRRGQLCTIDLFQSESNYNFIVVATSGAGKSFFSNEIIMDFLCKGGLVRIIDVGRSYEKQCSIFNGENLVFNPKNPRSLNPFWNMRDRNELNEMMDILHEMIIQMAYPQLAYSEVDPFVYKYIPIAITECWDRYGAELELRHVYEYFKESSDQRITDLSVCIHDYAVGRHSSWFNGPSKIELNNRLVILELEELNTQGDLKSVIMALVMGKITRDMYLGKLGIPKLMLIDEAWDLFAGLKSGKFIETAFRRIRKYNGSAGVITQNFEDFEKSPASQAAIANAAWQFILAQKPESLAAALKNERIVINEALIPILQSVKKGKGYSEIYVKGDRGSGIYRYVVDRHTYYMNTSNAAEKAEIEKLLSTGKNIVEAIDALALSDYPKMWGCGFDEVPI